MDAFCGVVRPTLKVSATPVPRMTQVSAFKKCKERLSPNQVVVVVNFAENYVAKQFAEPSHDIMEETL